MPEDYRGRVFATEAFSHNAYQKNGDGAPEGRAMKPSRNGAPYYVGTEYSVLRGYSVLSTRAFTTSHLIPVPLLFSVSARRASTFADVCAQVSQFPNQAMNYGRSEWDGQYPQTAYGHSPTTSSGESLNMTAHPTTRPPPVGSQSPHIWHGLVADRSQDAHTLQLSTVYSFVPIPGAQQYKRPRRRFEEIERMYRCGWNGCEKAYGTLNHLNAHVTMQRHGTKRTPEGKQYMETLHVPRV